MVGIFAVYGLVVSIMIANTLRPETHLFTAFVHLGARIAVGLASLEAGFAIGITGDAGVRGSSQQPKLFVGMMLIHSCAHDALQHYVDYLLMTLTARKASSIALKNGTESLWSPIHGKWR